MSSGVYGNIRPSLLTPSDVDIFYSYRPSRGNMEEKYNSYKQLDSSILASVKTDLNEVLPGAYNLKLPLNIFGKKGIYSIYIKPKEIKTTIRDVGILASFSDVKGIVIANNTFNFSNNDLVGYRVEYFNVDGQRENFFRLITSSNKCEPINGVNTGSTQSATRYRFNETASLMFCTLTPSSANSFKPNSLPFIGKTGQTISLINTKFNPIMLEIDMVEHDFETLATLVSGDQMRDLDHGLITTFTTNGEIYKQVDTFTLKESATGKPIFDVRKDRGENIDFNQDINEVISNS